MLNERLLQMRKPFVVLYRIADVTDGLTAASSAGQSGVERNVSLTASSLLTLGKAHASMALRSLLHRLQREVGELRQEVAELRHAIQAINFVFLGRDSAIPKQAWMALAAPSVDVCPHRAECPVLDELRKQSQGD